MLNACSLQRSGDPLILCFVDFANPACAATALSALQGINLLHSDIERRLVYVLVL